MLQLINGLKVNLVQGSFATNEGYVPKFYDMEKQSRECPGSSLLYTMAHN
jgi:hypothetical protein